MFAEESSVNALLVKDQQNNYLMLKANSTLPERYEVVETLTDVPMSLIKMLSLPRSIGDTLQILLEEDSKAKKYVSNLFDYERLLVGELENSSKK